MKLVFIHGAPAVGKLTVAKALLAAVPGRLFDNHAAIDVARTVFDFGAPGFWELIHEVRCKVVEAAAAQDTRLLVMTECYAEPDDLPSFTELEGIVLRGGGAVLPVFLHCSREEAMRRVGNPDRAERRKITSAEGLDAFVARYKLTQVPRPNCLSLQTDTHAPETTARDIIRHFGLT